MSPAAPRRAGHPPAAGDARPATVSVTVAQTPQTGPARLRSISRRDAGGVQAGRTAAPHVRRPTMADRRISERQMSRGTVPC